MAAAKKAAGTRVRGKLASITALKKAGVTEVLLYTRKSKLGKVVHVHAVRLSDGRHMYVKEELAKKAAEEFGLKIKGKKGKARGATSRRKVCSRVRKVCLSGKAVSVGSASAAAAKKRKPKKAAGAAKKKPAAGAAKKKPAKKAAKKKPAAKKAKKSA